ncbi:MAG: flavin reductase family protein [Candidatus Helarchaeota archaeon]
MIKGKSPKKVAITPTINFYPLPIVLITCTDIDYKLNIITISSLGIANEDPPLITIALHKERHSNKIVKKTMEFVVNIPNESLLEHVDFFGMVSGERIDKFEASSLTPTMGDHVIAPLIEECPCNLECRVKSVLSLYSHNLFIAEILAMHIDIQVLKNNSSKKIKMDALKPLIRMFDEYWSIKKKIAPIGFTLRKT